MAESIVRQDVARLVDDWLDSELKGERFPVPFDVAWQIAGYSTKGNGKRKLLNSGLIEGEDFAFFNLDKWTQDGRSSDVIALSCDAFKQFCLMAKTEEGRNARLYFIDCEKKWKLTQQLQPEVANQIELVHAQQELAKLEAQRNQSELALLQFRHIVASTMPDVVQQKVLGYQEIKTVEFRDRIIREDEIVRDGSTINKTTLCNRLGFLTRTGNPDYKRLNLYLESLKLPEDAWRLTASLKENYELSREYLGVVERRWVEGDRQRWLGE